METNFRFETTLGRQSSSTQSFSFEYSPDQCSCRWSSYCNTTTGIFTVSLSDEPNNSPDYYITFINQLYQTQLLFEVPGINVGCLILDAVLQSDLSCLYNSSCLSELNTYLNDSPYPFNATALNRSNSSLQTVKNLVDHLMVDEWVFNVSYESYFSQCNPSICSYTYVKRFNILFIITTLIGSIGGIVTTLMLVILPLVVFTRGFVCNRRRSLLTQTETG